MGRITQAFLILTLLGVSSCRTSSSGSLASKKMAVGEDVSVGVGVTVFVGVIVGDTVGVGLEVGVLEGVVVGV